MNLEFLAGSMSAAIHYQVSDVDPMVQREGPQFEFQPQTARVLVSGDEIQVHVEGPRRLRSGMLSPIQRVAERFNRADLDRHVDNGVPRWVKDLASYWWDVADSDSPLKNAIRNEQLLVKG